MGRTVPDDENVDMGQETQIAATGPVGNGLALPRSLAGAKGRVQGGGETQVDPVRHEVLRPFAPTMNAVMQYYKYTSTTITASTAAAGQASFSLRLNSINDMWASIS